jgi:hypothetical protein
MLTTHIILTHTEESRSSKGTEGKMWVVTLSEVKSLNRN